MSIQINFLLKKGTLLRYDVFPFILLYILTIILAFTMTSHEEIFSKLFFVFLFFLHAIVYLMGHWSNRLKSFILFSKFTKVTKDTINEASHVQIIQKKKNRSTVYEISEIYAFLEGDNDNN